MSRPEARAAKTGFEKIRAILHGDWDPIGCGVPEDEYDSYVWPTLRLLMDRVPRADVEEYLREAARGIASPVPEKRLAAVVDKLMALEIA